jgi:hypothetical protein
VRFAPCSVFVIIMAGQGSGQIHDIIHTIE